MAIPCQLKYMMIGENKLTTEQLEDMLRDYPNLNKRIKNRVDEIRNPYSPADENISGGKSDNGNGIEKSVYFNE